MLSLLAQILWQLTITATRIAGTLAILLGRALLALMQFAWTKLDRASSQDHPSHTSVRTKPDAKEPALPPSAPAAKRRVVPSPLRPKPWQ